MTRKSYVYGVDAEKMVIEHYQALGFELLKYRFKTQYGEIDLIMKNANSLVFIEVKARTNPQHEEFITARQIKRCCNTALHFMSSDGVEWLELAQRFDLVVVINNRIANIIENAWSC